MGEVMKRVEEVREAARAEGGVCDHSFLLFPVLCA